MRAIAVSMVALVLAVSGCGSALVGTSTAVWQLAPGQSVDADTTSFSVLVNRVACNSGVTGSVNDPTVERTDAELVITFTVSPGDPPAADCRGNEPVEYVIELDEPIGDRALVDGACRTTDARETVFCESELR